METIIVCRIAGFQRLRAREGVGLGELQGFGFWRFGVLGLGFWGFQSEIVMTALDSSNGKCSGGKRRVCMRVRHHPGLYEL